MTAVLSKSRTLAAAFVAMVVSVSGMPSAAAEAGQPVPQYTYKVISQRELKADVLYPDDWHASDKRAAIVFFSGGAWRTGGTQQFLKQAEYFAKRGMVTVRAEYRDSTKDGASPDTCLKDAVSAMRWVRKNSHVLGIDPQRIVSSGGSAGGYLAAAVATIDGFHSPSDDLSVSPQPNAMVLFNPVVDFVTLDRAAEFGITGELAMRISPLQHLAKNLPPTLILIGTKDPFLEQNKQFVSKAEQLGVRVELDLAEGQPHAYFNRSPWLEKTVASADRFLVSLGYLGEGPRVALPTSTPSARTPSLKLDLRRRRESEKSSGEFTIDTRTVTWEPKATAIVICDMWDSAMIPKDPVTTKKTPARKKKGTT